MKKHVVLLEVLGDKWRTIKLALQRVRPFVWGSVMLKDADGGQLDPEDEEGLSRFLEQKVRG